MEKNKKQPDDDGTDFDSYVNGVKVKRPSVYIHESKAYTADELLAKQREVIAQEEEEERLALENWHQMGIEQDFLDDIVIKIRMEDGSIIETYMETSDFKC